QDDQLGPPRARDRRQRAGGPADRRRGQPHQGAGLCRFRPRGGLRRDPGGRLGGVGDQRARPVLRAARDLGRRHRRRQPHGRGGERLRRLHRRGAHLRHPQFAADGRRRFELAGHVRRPLSHRSGLSRESPRSQARVTLKGARVEHGRICMLKLVLTGAVAAGALISASAAVRAAEPYTFALVPKNTNNPFFDQALAGCKKAEKELKGAIKCLYIGPGEHGGGDEEAQIVADLITKKVDGIAVSPANAPAMANALKGAAAAHIPVLTWDSDLLPQDKGLRAAYIGTHNYDIGVNLAKLVMAVKPKGGTICIQSGGAAAANHNERMQGIRDTLSGKKSAE